MNIKQFKLVTNRQRPDFCYAYNLKTDKRKFSIFTMDGGATFTASIEDPNLDKRWYSVFSHTSDSVSESLEAINKFNDTNSAP